MTECKLYACACVLFWDEPLRNEVNITQKIQCRTHNTATDALIHARLFPTDDNNARTDERAKPIYQRR